MAASSGSLQGSADSPVPQSWVAMRSDEGEIMHRLRHDEGTPVSLAGMDAESIPCHGQHGVIRSACCHLL